MNIVFVIYNADVVGAVMSSTRREAEFLAERGHRVILLSNRDPAWSGVEYREVQTPHGWAHRQLDYLANGFSRRLPHGMGALDCRTVIPFVDLGAAAAQLVAALIGEGACDRVVICQHPCFL